jgi:hypothetical protein
MTGSAATVVIALGGGTVTTVTTVIPSGSSRDGHDALSTIRHLIWPLAPR